jgi:hypothetical protein
MVNYERNLMGINVPQIAARKWFHLFWYFIGAFAVVLLTIKVGLAQFVKPIPPPEMQNPLIKAELGTHITTVPIVRLAGGQNEHLILKFQIRRAHLSTCQIKIEGNGLFNQKNIDIYQLTCAPPGGGFQSDALIPWPQRIAALDDVFDIWVTIKIPTHMPAGVYHGALTFIDGKLIYKQPLELRVWDFVLPPDIPIPIMANCFTKPKQYGRYGGNSQEQFDQKVRSYLRSMREYKINALGNFYPFPVKQFLKDKKVENFPEYEHFLQYVVHDLNYRFFRIPLLSGAREIGEPGNDWPAMAKIYYPLFTDYLRRHHLESQAFIKVVDEPSPQEYPKVIKAYRLIKSLVPNIRTESAGRAPNPNFAKIIDIWVSYAKSYDPQAIAQARRMGQEVWLYANKLHGIDQPLVNQRLIGWYLYRYKFQGYFFWAMDNWKEDPWTSTFMGRGVNLLRGTFYYPHPKTGMPIPTTRLESLRRGWEDYQYLDLLAKAAKKGQVRPEEYRQIMQRVDAVTEGLKILAPRISWAELEELRLRIGELLDRAAGGRDG